MIVLTKELSKRRKILLKKVESDTQIYGKPLGNKGLQDKIDATKRKIARLKVSMDKLQGEMDAKHTLSKWDKKVLQSIRGNTRGEATGSINNYRFDNRFSGSASSRKSAKHYRP